MSKYSHSTSFATLKATNETIKKNLTSHQYLTILDNHLYNAVSALVTGTRFFDLFLGQIIGWQTNNPRRKTCGVGRHDLVNLSTLYFLTEDPKQRVKIIRKMKLHRNILTEAIQRWLDVVAQYPELAKQVGSPEVLLKLDSLNSVARVRPGWSLHAIHQEVKYWLGQVRDFKESIIQKYTRTTIMKAQRDYVALGCPGRLDDFVQIYMMTMSKAIDKCDADRGVLTTHIDNWLLSAKNTAQDQANDKHDINQTVPLDDAVQETSVCDEEDRERQALIMRVRTVSKVFDPEGYGRISLGITEHLTQEDRQILRALAV